MQAAFASQSFVVTEPLIFPVREHAEDGNNIIPPRLTHTESGEVEYERFGMVGKGGKAAI